MTTIAALASMVHENALAKGWWNEARDPLQVLFLIGSELAEAGEEYRNGHGLTEVYEGEDGKPEGFPMELADVAIRLFDFCAQAGIDLEAAIWRKHLYNQGRPYRHGGKLA